LLYPTTILLPKGHDQHAEVTFFVSLLCSGCKIFPPVLKIVLLSWISHNIIWPFRKITRTLQRNTIAHKFIFKLDNQEKKKNQIIYIKTSKKDECVCGDHLLLSAAGWGSICITVVSSDTSEFPKQWLLRNTKW
jgi:hypothetical protein